MKTRLILWTGPRHSGKTTTAADLAQKTKSKGFSIAGLLAPSIYIKDHLTGFDAVNIATGDQIHLAERKQTNNSASVDGFTFSEAGLEFGYNALDIAYVKSADLIIVDEFGPLELAGGGWRKNADSILSDTNALLVLVVRDDIIHKVKKNYEDVICIQLDAAKADSAEKVIKILKNQQEKK